MKNLFVLCFLFLSACSEAQPTLDESIIRLETLTGSVCSGTVVKPNVILTASHCLKDGEELYAVNKKRTKLDIKEFIHDERDNSLIILNKNQFKETSLVDFRNKQKKGDKLYIYGNVMGFESILRRGYVAGFVTQAYDITFYDMNIWKGDSGSCVFNSYRKCIAVVSFFTSSPDGMFKIGGSGKFGFKKETLKRYNL